MIKSFGNKLTQNLFYGIPSKETRYFPKALHHITFRKLSQLYAATELETMNVPPGNRLKALEGRWKGFHSIRINDQWRICFQWTEDGAEKVQITDYH